MDNGSIVYTRHRTKTSKTKQNTTHKAEKISNTPLKNWGWNQMLANDTKSLPFIRHPRCYPYSQDVVNITIRKQTKLTLIRHRNWMQRGTEHRFDAVIVADITPRNGVFKEIIGQKVGHNYPYLPQMKLRHFDGFFKCLVCKCSNWLGQGPLKTLIKKWRFSAPFV